MKITYLNHSGFIVEYNKAVLLFDYYKGTIPKFSKDMSIYVFVSHKHYDHFNKEIFSLADEYDNIKFILSKDTKMNEAYMDRLGIIRKARECIHYVEQNRMYEFDEHLKVETFSSTDAGVAFLITLWDRTIYHAGDLNWWTWKGETSEEYISMSNRYITEVLKLKGRKIDLSFLVLDPRQEERFYLGLDFFMRVTVTKWVIPMHFWEKPDVILRLKELKVSGMYHNKIIALTKEGDYVRI